MITKFGPHTQVVLRKMCSAVGADPEKIDFQSNNWFWEYTWTKEEEDDFREWLARYLYESNAARKEILRTNRKNLKHCRKAADFFVWNHGWKLEDETINDNNSGA